MALGWERFGIKYERIRFFFGLQYGVCLGNIGIKQKDQKRVGIWRLFEKDYADAIE